MAGKPKEAQYQPCHCQRCNGKLVDPANWLLHNGKVTSGMSWVAQELREQVFCLTKG